MVSIRSDDIRGRWGRLIDNLASFIGIEVSGTISGLNLNISSGIIVPVISGNTISLTSGLIANQISGTNVNIQSGLIVPVISGNTVSLTSGLISNQISGNIFNIASGITTPQISGVNINIQSGIVAGAVTVSGTTLLQGITTIGAGASGFTFSGLQHLPVDTNVNYVITVNSGQTLHRAVNTKTGIVEQSGGSGFAATVIQYAITSVIAQATSGGGGRITLQDGDFDLVLSGIVVNLPRRLMNIDFGGVGEGTILNYRGASGTYALTISGINTSLYSTKFHDFKLDGSSGQPGGTYTSGCNGVNIAIPGGMNIWENVQIRRFDVGLDITNNNGTIFRDCILRSCFTGVRTVAGAITNPNLLTFDHCFLTGCDTGGDFLSTPPGVAEIVTFVNGDADSNGVGIKVGGGTGTTCITVERSYFELNSSGDIWLAGFSGTSKVDEVNIVSCRGTGAGVSGTSFIRAGFVGNLKIDNCEAYGYTSGAMVFLEQDAGSDMVIINPRLRAGTPYLIDCASGQSFGITSRLAGKIIEGKQESQIVLLSQSGMAIGDVINSNAGQGLYFKTTTGPNTSGNWGVVTWPNAGVNRHGAIALPGSIVHVNTVSGSVTRGDTLVAHTVAGQAVVNNTVIDPRSIIGYTIQVTSGLVYSRIL